MKQVNYLDEDYKKNLRNKVWELLKNGLHLTGLWLMGKI